MNSTELNHAGEPRSPELALQEMHEAFSSIAINLSKNSAAMATVPTVPAATSAVAFNNSLNNNGPTARSTSRADWTWAADADRTDEAVSEVVEARLLQAIFSQFASDKGELHHSRFLRFAKQFHLTPEKMRATTPENGPNGTDPMLVPGEVDLVFRNAIKFKPEHEKAPFGTGTTRFTRRSQTGSAAVMSLRQFTEAIRQFALRLYSPLCEKEFGTTLEYLPPTQRAMAAHAMHEVLIKKKLIPEAERARLLPWPLIFVDRTVELLREPKSALSECVEHRIESLALWFAQYADNSFGRDVPCLGYKAVSSLCRVIGVVPYLLKEPQLYNICEEMLLWRRQEPAELLAAAPPGLKAHHLAAGEVVYLSKVAQGAQGGGRGKIRASTNASSSSSLDAQLGFLSFSLLLATLAVQGFPGFPHAERFVAFLEWADKSGGTLLLNRASIQAGGD